MLDPDRLPTHTRSPRSPSHDTELFSQVTALLSQIARMPDRTVFKSEARRLMRGLPTAEYRRRSKRRGGEAYGPEAQGEDIAAAVEREGFEPPTLRYEDQISASGKVTRTDFERMLADASAGRFKILLVGRPDRFARNVPMGWIYIYQLILSGVYIYFCDEDCAAGLDKGWHDVVSKKLADAEATLRVITENNQKHAALRQKKGLWRGPAPFGWQLGKDKKPLPKTGEIEIVDRAWELLLEGALSLQGIADRLTLEGHRNREGKGFTANHMHDIFTNPLIYGTWRLNISHGRRDPRYREEPNMSAPREGFTEAMFMRGKAILAERAITRKSVGSAKHDYLLRGLVRCAEIDPATGRECGIVFWGMTNQPYSARENVVYEHPREMGCCAGRRGFRVSERPLLAQLDAIHDRANLPEDAQTQIASFLSEEDVRTRPNRALQLKALQQELTRVDVAFRRGSYGEDPAVAEVIWQRERNDVLARIVALPPDPVSPSPEAVTRVLGLGEIWRKGTFEERRQLVNALWSAICVDRNCDRTTVKGAPRKRGLGTIQHLVPSPENELLVTWAFGGGSLPPRPMKQRTHFSDRSTAFLTWVESLVETREAA